MTVLHLSLDNTGQDLNILEGKEKKNIYIYLYPPSTDSISDLNSISKNLEKEFSRTI